MPAPVVSFFLGALLGFSIAVPPGPVLALMAGDAARGRPGRAILTGLGATSGDALWALAAAIGFVTVLSSRPWALGILGIAGAGLLFWMAFAAIRAARSDFHERTGGGYGVGIGTVLTSPFNLAWWVGTGPFLYGTLGLIAVIGFFLAIVSFVFIFTYSMAWVGRRVEDVALWVSCVSAVLLTAFGLLILYVSMQRLAVYAFPSGGTS
ncbi:MAG: LysE family translocator [Thermoplasmatota archaeon]